MSAENHETNTRERRAHTGEFAQTRLPVKINIQDDYFNFVLQAKGHDFLDAARRRRAYKLVVFLELNSQRFTQRVVVLRN